MDVEFLVFGLSRHLSLEAGPLVISLLKLVLPVLLDSDEVSVEPELLLKDSVSKVSSLHVLVLQGNGQNQVQVEVVNYVSQKSDCDDEAHVLEVCHLDVHGPELNPPSDLGVLGWRRLEPHGVPVG